MGWKGTLRSIQAAQRRAERDALRRRRELERQNKLLEKMQDFERAAYEVQVFENYLEVLLSIHKECGESWDWQSIRDLEPPLKPTKSSSMERAAQAELDNYKPSTVDKLMKRVELKREQLAKAVEEAQQADENNYQKAVSEYEQELLEWEKTTELANRILADVPEAHLEAIKEADPFSEINQLGSSIDFLFDGDLIEAILHVNGEDIIPSESKSLLKSGKVSVKKMTKSKFYELYQDYVCGAVLRVARELFALLPIEMVIVTANGALLNTITGHMEQQPILSAAIPRKTIEDLNFDMIDPSDSMINFVHRMKFMKTKGFSQVERILPEELQSQQL
ncbi:MAG: hypothetical protein M9941_12695 [Anaerolineae bacterium]|nr:hypothetical protein [Anaerolineae bacterium]MCO5198594.1 hypothetical protein [Anaerolineae bacterium]